MGGSCIYLREWFNFMINVGKYIIHWVIELQALKSWSLVGVWREVPRSVICFYSSPLAMHQPPCSEGIMKPKPCLSGLVVWPAIENAWFPNRKWCTLDLGYLFSRRKIQISFFFSKSSISLLGHFFEMQAIYIWIGGDLPSPHNVSSQLPNVTGTPTTSVPPKSRLFSPRPYLTSIVTTRRTFLMWFGLLRGLWRGCCESTRIFYLENSRC